MKKVKKILFVFSCFFLVSVALWGQSNQLIDRLLEEKKARYGDVVNLVFQAAELVPEDATTQEALNLLSANNWGLKVKGADSPITLGDFSFILMKSFDMKGGIMYSLLPSPRYAARELAYLGYLLGRSAADRRVSGEEVLHVIGKVLESQEKK